MRAQGGYIRTTAAKGFLFIAIIGLVIAPVAAVASEAGNTRDQLNKANVHAAEKEGHVHDLDNQIAKVENQIRVTYRHIATTNAAIAEAKDRMAEGQAKLNGLIRKQYQQQNQTKLEQLVGANSFSEFVNTEKYLQTTSDEIADTIDEILQAKKQLEAKADQLNKLQGELAAQQNGLNYARAAASNELAQINASRAELKKKLASYGGRIVRAGDQVNAGDLIGFEGSTGYSTGSHLHFEVRKNGSPVNPRSYTPGRFKWPYEGGFSVNQEFGQPNWAAAYDFHTGIDLGAYFGAPILAAASGRVSYSGVDSSGFGEHVIIDHGGDLQTLYGHLAQGQ